jgi:hypothetical protein
MLLYQLIRTNPDQVRSFGISLEPR